MSAVLSFAVGALAAAWLAVGFAHAVWERTFDQSNRRLSMVTWLFLWPLIDLCFLVGFALCVISERFRK